MAVLYWVVGGGVVVWGGFGLGEFDNMVVSCTLIFLVSFL